MQNLGFYFDLGWHHIIAWDAIDHLLFVLVLSAIYLTENWRQVLFLVTAFTIGHSLTLALSVFNLINISDQWVEFLIPVTIIITALMNLLKKNDVDDRVGINYLLALFFGLIHGLGFANAIRFMMSGNDSLGWNLLGFNAGLEAGQVVVVTAILFFSYLLVGKAGLPRKWWVWSLSIFALSVALKMAWERFPALVS